MKGYRSCCLLNTSLIQMLRSANQLLRKSLKPELTKPIPLKMTNISRYRYIITYFNIVFLTKELKLMGTNVCLCGQ